MRKTEGGSIVGNVCQCRRIKSISDCCFAPFPITWVYVLFLLFFGVCFVLFCWGWPAALMPGFEPGRHLGTGREEGIYVSREIMEPRQASLLMDQIFNGGHAL